MHHILILCRPLTYLSMTSFRKSSNIKVSFFFSTYQIWKAVAKAETQKRKKRREIIRDLVSSFLGLRRNSLFAFLFFFNTRARVFLPHNQRKRTLKNVSMRTHTYHNIVRVQALIHSYSVYFILKFYFYGHHNRKEKFFLFSCD